MNWAENEKGYVLRGAEYSARIEKNEETPRVYLSFDGREMASLPMVSAFDAADGKESLSNVSICSMLREGNELVVTLAADSDLWGGRRFIWRFGTHGITYRHAIHGRRKLGRCYFFASGMPVLYERGDSNGYKTNAAFQIPHYRTFNPNLANALEFDISQPGFVGVGRSEGIGRADYINIERHHGIFSPGPLCFAFYEDSAVMSIGIGAQPGEYRFNGLEYSGVMKEGASFYVQYAGFTSADGEFLSPEVEIEFGYDPFESLRRYVEWIDRSGYGTSFAREEACWERRPVFCGWAEQTATCPDDKQASQMATQTNYENWVNAADALGLPFGTIVIDDKWQRYYGTFEIDTDKWPDLPGFVARQHALGRRVLLWIPSYQAEGIPAEWCAKDADGKPLFALAGNEAYDAFVREGVIRLIKETDIDGFKEDWFGRTGDASTLGYGALHGLEFVRSFQSVVYQAMHEAKPDTCMETQTPNPLFRESSDMLRLNDIWYATRQLPDMMRDRARIARVAGWRLMDCDNASSTTIAEWFAYAQAQPLLGTPALYFLTRTESARDPMTKAHTDYLAAIWDKYIEDNAL